MMAQNKLYRIEYTFRYAFIDFQGVRKLGNLKSDLMQKTLKATLDGVWCRITAGEAVHHMGELRVLPNFEGNHIDFKIQKMKFKC